MSGYVRTAGGHGRTKRAIVALVAFLFLLLSGGVRAALTGAQTGESSSSRRSVTVASKPFGESYLLCEMFAQLLEANGIAVDRRPGLGATEVAFRAIRSGAIDVYPEYTGTGLLAILHDSLPDSLARDSRAVYAHVAHATTERYGARWLPPLGFENTYAIAVRRETASRHGLRTLSDLARASTLLTGGLTADFIGRPDGLPGLRRTYDLRPRSVRPLAPALKYQALATGAVDFVDGYSTDGLLAKYDLVVLVDDKRFFPPYQAAALVGARVTRERPDAISALSLLSGRFSDDMMRSLNRRVEVDGEPIADVAKDALRALGLLGQNAGVTHSSGPAPRPFIRYLWVERGTIADLTLRHMMLVAAALLAAVLVAVPLGLILERARESAGLIMAVLGVIETVPGIALLAFMIPLLGVGVWPAFVALWLYALYPIARGTFTGVRAADPGAVEAAEALGATPRQRLLLVRLPLAAPFVMAGVRTAAVITVGTATLAAFIGAGGLGEPIVAGLALADTRLVLSGALPAAALALVVDGLLAVVERRVTPQHLRWRSSARRIASAEVGIMTPGSHPE